MSKKIIILRGKSGGGKSFFASVLCENPGYVECNADFFFTRPDGSYHFKPDFLGAAHAECRAQFQKYLQDESVKAIVVSNTNTKREEWKFYENEGKAAGAEVIFAVVENRHGGHNQHNVPLEVLARQETNIKNSLAL